MSNFTRTLGKSERIKDPVEIASVAIFNEEGELLIGLRNDDGKYELIGGHMLPNESPESGARREAAEESGLELADLQRLGEGRSGKHLIHSYKARGIGKPTNDNDPDKEFKELKYVNVKDKLPDEIAKNLHSPKNITLRLLGLQEDNGIEKFEKDFLEILVKNLATNGISEWKGNDDTRAIVMPDNHRPGSLIVRWFDTEGFLGHSEPSPRLADIAKSLVEEFGVVKADPGALDRLAQTWTPRTMTLLKSTDVEQLLEHPDPNERSMAFKMAGVSLEDIARGLASDDSVLQRGAFQHPQFGGHALMLLMRLKNRHQLQLESLDRDDISSKHLKALYDTMSSHEFHPQNRAVLQAIAAHPQLDRNTFGSMWNDPTCEPCRRILIKHPMCPAPLLESIVSSALAAPAMGSISSLAGDALAHPAIPPTCLAQALQSNQSDLRIGASKNPDLSPEMIDNILAMGRIPRDIDPDAQIRVNSLLGNNVQGKHLDTALTDVHPDVRAAVFESPSSDLSSDYVDKAIASADMDLIEKAVNSRVATPEQKEAWLAMIGRFDPMDKTEDLKKATDPEHFKSIKRASDTAGRDLVDHQGEFQAHPDAIQHFVDNYKKNITGSTFKVKPHKSASAEARSAGVSRKLVYGISGNGPLFGEPNETKYMVKPYHERIIQRTAPYMKHPHQGWAEMTNQALYHAGGIGHLHQKVHVAEHNMGPGFENEPALVIKMDPGFKSVSDLPREKGADIWAPSKVKGVTDQTKQDARKIAIMDFLSNNVDRHHGNLMMNENGQLLAIDHPRSFQYIRTQGNKFHQAHQDHDSFGPYHFDSAIHKIDPLEKGSYDKRMATMESYRPAIAWWEQNSDKIKSAMTERLKLIKDPKIRRHIEENFNARANHLDQMADFGIENFGDDWYKQGAPLSLYGEDTDHENAYKRNVRRQQNRWNR